ncbi:MAG TPA: DUF2306 domain-containing protein [Pyrinomonadaceae bacterium]|nr:DUF2306 domain-containing protein [Pyrinomonadaceae bacterium]
MATLLPPQSRARAVNPKHVLFAVAGMMTLFVLYYSERFLLDPTHPAWEHFAKVRWWLLPHGLGGALALFLGPLQFSTRFRQRHLRWHRIAGRLYVAGVLVAAPVSLYIVVIQGPPQVISAGFVQAGGWLLTTAAALVSVLRGNIQQHRQWMVRSYSVTFIFVATRVLLAIPAVERSGDEGAIQVFWICIALAFLLPDFFVNWRAIWAARKS